MSLYYLSVEFKDLFTVNVMLIHLFIYFWRLLNFGGLNVSSN